MAATELATRDPGAVAASLAAAVVGLPGWQGTLAEHTRNAYSTDVRQFIAWLSDRGSTR